MAARPRDQAQLITRLLRPGGLDEGDPRYYVAQAVASIKSELSHLRAITDRLHHHGRQLNEALGFARSLGVPHFGFYELSNSCFRINEEAGALGGTLSGAIDWLRNEGFDDEAFYPTKRPHRSTDPTRTLESALRRQLEGLGQ